MPSLKRTKSVPTWASRLSMPWWPPALPLTVIFYAAERQSDVIVGDGQGANRQLVKVQKGSDRGAAVVHESLRLQQPDGATRDFNSGHIRLEARFPPNSGAGFAGEGVHQPKPKVGAGADVLRAWISQAGDDGDGHVSKNGSHGDLAGSVHPRRARGKKVIFCQRAWRRERLWHRRPEQRPWRQRRERHLWRQERLWHRRPGRHPWHQRRERHPWHRQQLWHRPAWRRRLRHRLHPRREQHRLRPRPQRLSAATGSSSTLGTTQATTTSSARSAKMTPLIGLRSRTWIEAAGMEARSRQS